MTTVVLALGLAATARAADADRRARSRFARPTSTSRPHDGEVPVDVRAPIGVGEGGRRSPRTHDELVIAADTTVDLGSRILGKPVDDRDAAAMLRRLSGRTHHVHTGVAVRLRRSGVRRGRAPPLVTFVELDDATVDWYVSTGEPIGKAGAYAIQGAGARVGVASVDGSVSNVIGLPLHIVVELAGICRRRAAGGEQRLSRRQNSGQDATGRAAAVDDLDGERDGLHERGRGKFVGHVGIDVEKWRHDAMADPWD